MLTLPQTAEYALKAVAYIAAAEAEGRPARVPEIAEALDVPRNYLSKTLHQLARAGVLLSTRGPQGGFRLAHAPDRVHQNTIVAPFLPAGGPVCILGRNACSDVRPCAAHHRWKPVREQMNAFFAKTSVADLLASPGATVPRSPSATAAALK